MIFNLVDNQEDVEQLVYLTNKDCLKARKPLVQFDLYVGTMMFAYPKNDQQALPPQFPVKMFHQDSISSSDDEMHFDPVNKNWATFSSSNTSSAGIKTNKNEPEQKFDAKFSDDNWINAPNCSEYPLSDFSMTSFEHLPVSFKFI